MSYEKINQLKNEINRLKQDLLEKQQLLMKLEQENGTKHENSYSELSTNEVVRYSRQMIMPQIKIDGQLLLKNSKVLVVGAGGLGCPATLYLASAGIGEITLLDYDEIELSNLHRQVLHTESDIGLPKVQSAYNKLTAINSNIKVIPIKLLADSNTIKDLIKTKTYDVIVDGSDNVATRYLLNDFCVLNKIPLVSGSALQMEGQLTVYNYEGGPCYRCLFPVPPPPNTVTNCGDGGVLGPVPGTIGVLQALETIKIITKSPGVLSQRLLLFDGATTTFRNIKLRLKSNKCNVCGENPTITELIDYEQFCGSRAHDKVININILNDVDNVPVQKLKTILDGKNLVIDVRTDLEYRMCKLPNTVNIPYNDNVLENGLKEVEKSVDGHKEVFVLCRRGNDSQRFIQLFREHFPNISFFNIKGGLYEYSKFVDNAFPVY